ncbi:MAG: hypothetical protein ACFB50_17170 [Rubrobacteraceae bacterium]
MDVTPKTPALRPWKDLQESLTGSFSVRARGLQANIFVFRKDGSRVGRLRLEGLRGAEFTAGELAATIERTADGGYRMFSGNQLILTATAGASFLEAFELACGGHAYAARVSFFRNEATVLSPAATETVRIKGTVTGRRYEVTLDETDAAALPAAVLLLYHTAAFRRRAYTA